jgi:hypothetical protein
VADVPMPEFKAPVVKISVASYEQPDHIIGDLDCAACWNDRFPQKCNDPHCPGLIHAAHEDESYDGYTLAYRCDVCGERDAPDDPPLQIDKKTWDALRGW